MSRVNQTKLEFIKQDIKALYDNLNFRALQPEKKKLALLGQIHKSIEFHVGSSAKDSLDYLDRLMEELDIPQSQ